MRLHYRGITSFVSSSTFQNIIYFNVLTKITIHFQRLLFNFSFNLLMEKRLSIFIYLFFYFNFQHFGEEKTETKLRWFLTKHIQVWRDLFLFIFIFYILFVDKINTVVAEYMCMWAQLLSQSLWPHKMSAVVIICLLGY